jgi:DNA-damage-inducible protein J
MTFAMAKTSQISARINPTDKKRAEKIFKELGVTASQAITLFYKQVYLRRGIPFPVELPNQETIDAIEEARSGRGKRFNSVDELMNDLGI